MNRRSWALLLVLASASAVARAEQPAPLRHHCTGTEPFWHVHVGPDDLLVARPDLEKEMRLGPYRIVTIEGLRQEHGMVYRQDGVSLYVFDHEGCSDGMSDRTFDKRAFFDLRGTIYQGCCHVIRQASVTRVAATDTLNIRSWASADATLTGNIPPTAAPFDAWNCQGGWCAVQFGTQRGWVHRRFLSFHDQDRQRRPVHSPKKQARPKNNPASR